ncbi:hypothetical protein GQ55_9G125100 [Panicum hallii var. hallii]|uniref:Secreted protein n=1 Tax=Panicum hallii var. hallii TaxID=1504633 RepID=A0A2T7C2D3_9POAL|nr:hypothetical protein GQ55_9G125100 [Panicum hallii var. hallii]
MLVLEALLALQLVPAESGWKRFAWRNLKEQGSVQTAELRRERSAAFSIPAPPPRPQRRFPPSAVLGGAPKWPQQGGGVVPHEGGCGMKRKSAPWSSRCACDAALTPGSN